MAEQNDGRIPGGPTTERERQERENHISRLVFSGELYDYPSHARIREHGRWRHIRDDPNSAKWELTSQQQAMVDSFGFHYINDVEFLQHDRDLIFSLAERWWPNRNTFQLPVGEMTVTLHDVANILGLPITGDPIYFSEPHDGRVIIQQYLGVPAPAPTGNRASRSDVNLTWLRNNFMFLNRTADGPVVVDENRIICCTRAYLLALCGSILFPNGTGCKVSVRFLPFMANLQAHTRHAWGAAVLAFLYASLTEFVKTTGDTFATNLSGCMMLLQVWSYEQFAIGRPISSISSETGIFPVAKRWTVLNIDHAHCRYQSASIYRAQFDVLNEQQVTWYPYFMGPNPPEIQSTSFNNSGHRFYIICDSRTMYHPADRVLRQFFMIQTIPDPPPASNYSHARVSSRIQSLLPGWESRYQDYNIMNISRPVQSRDDFLGDAAYKSWWGAPRMGNRRYRFEETRFANRDVDIDSMRTFINRFGQFRIEMGRSLVASRHMQSDMWQPLAVDMIERMATCWDDSVIRGPEPNMPPILLPPEYPSGFVRQRRSRYVQAEEEEQAEAHIDPPSQAGEGTSYQAGEGTSYHAGEGTSYHAGEGTSYLSGEGTSYQGGRASSYQSGEGTSYQGGRASSYEPGEGTSYQGGRASSYEPGEWCFSTPSAPIPTQVTQEHQDTQEPHIDPPNLRPNRRRSYLRWVTRGRS